MNKTVSTKLSYRSGTRPNNDVVLPSDNEELNAILAGYPLTEISSFDDTELMSPSSGVSIYTIQ